MATLNIDLAIDDDTIYGRDFVQQILQQELRVRERQIDQEITDKAMDDLDALTKKVEALYVEEHTPCQYEQRSSRRLAIDVQTRFSGIHEVSVTFHIPTKALPIIMEKLLDNFALTTMLYHRRFFTPEEHINLHQAIEKREAMQNPGYGLF